jgi:hypothetical protein
VKNLQTLVVAWENCQAEAACFALDLENERHIETITSSSPEEHPLRRKFARWDWLTWRRPELEQAKQAHPALWTTHCATAATAVLQLKSGRVDAFGRIMARRAISAE